MRYNNGKCHICGGVVTPTFSLCDECYKEFLEARSDGGIEEIIKEMMGRYK